MPFTPQKPSLYGETLQDLETAFDEAGQPRFRARQVVDWLYKHRVADFDGMTNLPQALRAWLAGRYVLLPLTHVFTKKAGDITEKLLGELEDQRLIETVLIRYPQEGVGNESSRKTVCVSSQVGCAYGCKFCASGLDGWKRNLTAAEIVGQLIHVCRLEDARNGKPEGTVASFDNIVFMGMGEPLANYDYVVRAIAILNADWGMRFGARRITVSTSGLVPQILKLADEPMQIRLAISLHGATNETRSRIMPVNRKYPLEELVPAARVFAEKKGRMLTLEYILIEDVNDMLTEAAELAKIAGGLHAHVNLIPYNSVEGLEWKRPNILRQQAFATVLKKAGVSHTIRKEKGHDIDAACGQLRLRKEREREAGAGAVES